MLLAVGSGYWWWKRPSAETGMGAAGGPPGGGSSSRSGGMRGGGAIAVAVGTVTRGTIEEWVTVPATVTPLQVVVVRSRVDGELQKVHFAEGQKVKAGDLLAEIDPRPFEVALEQAKAQLARDEAMLTNAKLVLDRYEVLLRQNSIARQEVDTQASLVRQNEAALAADRAAIESAKLQLSYTKITAPITGRAGLRRVDVGNIVRSSSDTGIVVLTQEDPIGLLFSIPQDRVKAVRQRLADGAPVTVEVMDSEMAETLAQGRLLSTDNQIDLASGTLKLKAELPNGDGALFPNQFVIARLLVNTVTNAVVAPATAVQRGAQGPYAFVIAGEVTAQLRQIETGIVQGERVMITEGLNAGEKVVTQGVDRLRDGAQVQVVDPAAKPGQGGKPPGAAKGPESAAK